MIVYCTGRALVAEFNSFLEAALQLIFQQLVFTCLVIIASYWYENTSKKKSLGKKPRKKIHCDFCA